MSTATTKKNTATTTNALSTIEKRCQPGDLWQLGDAQHRLLCGDSTNPANVRRLFHATPSGMQDGEGKDIIEVDAVLTDPPYCSGGWQESGKGMGSIGTTRKSGEPMPMLHNDTLSTRGYMALIKAAVMTHCQAKIINIFTDWKMWMYLFDVAESSGYHVRNMAVWNKETPGLGMGWRSQHELILVGTKVRGYYKSMPCQGNVITAKRSGNRYHPTEKPVELLKKILAVTPQAKVIYDPFAGSGSTIIAAELLSDGRCCYACEIDPVYSDATIARYEALSGHKASLIDRIA